MFTSLNNDKNKPTLDERYDTQFEAQRGVCASCGDIVVFPRLFGIPAMTWTGQLVSGAPDELIYGECRTALQKAMRPAKDRREEYIRTHVGPIEDMPGVLG